ncbi:terminase small subunit [uncultured Bacteroides sp.]|uniref:terminase small subunit n=1 Tax=uncultured Bacteroides sp. TaxID=162156 RepID=UPI002621E50A|nr:terminase small subunit [uncultured Bacteroides sp.]
MGEINIRQKAFVDEWLKCGNATEAAIKAGYSKKYAGTNADKLLKNTKIAAYIAERQKQIEDSRIADVSEVLQFFSSVMRGEVKDQFEMDAALSDRLSAGRELMKRYEKSDDGKKDALAKLDEVLKEIGGVI